MLGVTLNVPTPESLAAFENTPFLIDNFKSLLKEFMGNWEYIKILVRKFLEEPSNDAYKLSVLLQLQGNGAPYEGCLKPILNSITVVPPDFFSAHLVNMMNNEDLVKVITALKEKKKNLDLTSLKRQIPVASELATIL